MPHSIPPWTILTIASSRADLLRLTGLARDGARHPGMPILVPVFAGTIPEWPDFPKGFRVEPAYNLAFASTSRDNGIAPIIAGLEPIVSEEVPDLVLVQGDGMTALAGALTAGMRGVPVARIEAVRPDGQPGAPLRRRLLAQLSDLHLAASTSEVQRLMLEDVPPERIVEAGDLAAESIAAMVQRHVPGPACQALLDGLAGRRVILLSTGVPLTVGRGLPDGLAAIRGFLDRTPDTSLLWPIEPDEVVREAALEMLGHHPRVRLIDPVTYPDRLALTDRAWLVVADDWSAEAEAAALDTPVLILQGGADGLAWPAGRLTGVAPRPLDSMLEELGRRWPAPAGSGSAGSGHNAAARTIGALGALLARTKEDRQRGKTAA